MLFLNVGGKMVQFGTARPATSNIHGMPNTFSDSIDCPNIPSSYIIPSTTKFTNSSTFACLHYPDLLLQLPDTIPFHSCPLRPFSPLLAFTSIRLCLYRKLKILV
jgi:hypothetical protein